MTFTCKMSRRGAVAMLAMLYLGLFGTLTVAMYIMATLNSQSAANYSAIDHARSTAESGLRWIQYRFQIMDRPKTRIGNITPTVADNLWPQIRTSLTNDLNTLSKASERPVSFTNNHFVTSWVKTDETGGQFQIDITQDPKDKTRLVVSSIGRFDNAERMITIINDLLDITKIETGSEALKQVSQP